MEAKVVRDGRAVAAALVLGVVSFALLPWYFLADKSVLQALPSVWGPADGASGVLQAAAYGRWWLWAVPIGLAIAFVGARATLRRHQGTSLVIGALVGLAAVLVGGFAVAGEPGLGVGGALTLLASLLLLAFLEAAVALRYFMHLKYEVPLLFWTLIPGLLLAFVMMNQFWADAARLNTLRFPIP